MSQRPYPAIHTFSFRDQFANTPGFTIDNALEISAAMGFTSMEVMTGKAGSVEDIGTDTLDGLRDFIARAEKHGIKIHCYSTYNDFAFTPNEEWRLANIEYIKTWLKFAGDTGVPNIRMLTGYWVKDEDHGRLTELVYKGIEECVPIAEACGVNMAVENHSSVYMTGKEIVEVIEKIGSPRLTTCPDPSNGFNVFAPDCTDQVREAAYDNLRVMAPRATNAHLKIKGVTPNGRLEGWDLDRILDIYEEAGYAGPITFESIAEGDLLAPLARAREVLEEAIQRRKTARSS
jgi:L-ribulose-5-phosphate 3-epimerase